MVSLRVFEACGAGGGRRHSCVQCAQAERRSVEWAVVWAVCHGASLLQVRVLAGGSCDHALSWWHSVHRQASSLTLQSDMASISLSPSDGPSRTLVCLSSFVVLLCWPCWRRRLAPSASLSPSAAWPLRLGRFTAGAVLSVRYCAVPKHTCVYRRLASVYAFRRRAATDVLARRACFFSHLCSWL